MKKFYIITAILFCSFTKLFAQPATPANTPPARNTTDVVSIYGSAYTNVDSTDFFPGWGQTTLITEFYVGTDTMIKYSNFNYEGIQLIRGLDVSNMTKLHFDFWSANCTSFEVSLINTSPAPTVEQAFTVTPTLGGWNSFDIDLSNYNNIALHNISQIKLVSTPFGGTPGPTVYLDNIYFYKTATTPTITNFSIPSKNAGNSAFLITAPTSNSTGAFTYTSSNPAVATVTGSTITILSVGNTTIKATQAAAGGYTVGTKSTMFTVNSGLASVPTIAAPVPTKAQANVISLYSNTYQNRTVDTWSAVWDQADVADFPITGNDTKKYTNLVYAGIEFTTSTINATNADYFHIDIWTPNATAFKVKLVDFGANGTYAGGDDKEFEYTCNPPAYSTWVSYDIPMSAFTTLTTKGHIAQLIISATASTVYVDNVFFWANTAVLPVTLKSFTANKKENNIVLNWSSNNEVNLTGYDVQRSIDGKSFETIQFVPATQSSNYNTIDAKPINGVNYYRLKMLDNNGKYSYSNIISINNKNTANAGLSIYPNPAKNNFYVAINNIESNNATLKVVDITGKVIKTIFLNQQSANNNLLIDVSGISKGFYTLVLTDAQKTTTSKFIVE